MIIIFLGNCMYSSHDRTSYFQKTQNRIAVVPMFALYRKILPNDETIRDLFKSKIILIIAIILFYTLAWRTSANIFLKANLSIPG